MKKGLFAILALATLSFTACKDKTKDPDPVDPVVETTVTLEGDIKENKTLDKSKKYIIKGFVYVTDGATLTIPAGTILMGDKATKGTLVITRGSKIDAQGTSTEPIVFTSAQAAGARTQGDWGGIIILGKASINQAGGEAKIEGGLTPTDASNEKKYIWYGGAGAADDNDNSGILKYVRIEFAGIAFSVDNEINGLTMGGVGRGTTIDYVEVYRSGDDAFEWFGGTVNCKHLLAIYSWDDDFDTDNGYSGRVQFGVAQRSKTIADQSTSNAFESDNDATGSTNTPKTAAIFSNMTIVGPQQTAGTSGISLLFANAAQIRRNSSESIYNSLFIGFPVGLYIDGSASTNNCIAGNLNLKNNLVAGCATKYKSNAAWSDSTNWNAMSTNNPSLDSAWKVMLVDPYKFSAAVQSPAGRPNFLLQASSPANSGSNFTFTGNADFTPTTYRGAFDQTNDWTQGWATFDAESTAY